MSEKKETLNVGRKVLGKMGYITIEELEKTMKKDLEVKESFFVPIKKLLLSVKLVNRDKGRKIKTPYVKAEILIPHNIASSVVDVIKSDWNLVLMGIKYAKNRKEKKTEIRK